MINHCDVSRYQTGALTPFLRWLSQSAQRAMMPPQPQQPVHPVPPPGMSLGVDGSMYV